jgi:two-component system sensor histidine kinase/response regulator
MAGGVEPTGAIDYPRLFETGSVLFAIADLRGRLQALNPAWEAVLGHPRSELIGTSVVRLLHPDDKADLALLIKQALEGGETVDFIARMQAADGTYRYLEWQASVVGEQVYGSAVDVTERQSAVAELRRSQERHRRLFEVTAQAVLYFDAAGHVVAANPAAERLLGIRATELPAGIGNTLWRTIREDRTEFPTSEHPAQVALRTGCEVAGVLMGVASRDSPDFRWLRIRAIPEIDPRTGEIIGACSTFDAVTEAREIQQQLARQNESLRRAAAAQTASRALLDNMMAALNKHAIVSTTDLAGRITSFNDNFVAICGYRPEEILGQTHKLVNSGHHPQQFWAQLWETISQGHTWHGEICNRAKDGRFFWVYSTIQPFRDSDGRVYQYVSIRTDITAQKEAERAAEAANQAKSRFLATMSHEIRTPLTAIIGLSHLADQTSMDPSVAATLAQIRSSGEYLLAMLNDVLDFSKIEVQELVLRMDPMDPADVAAEAVAMHRSLAQSKGLLMELSVAPEVPPAVLGDDVRLRQVLLNLVSNAVKCTDSGSVRVNIAAGPGSDPDELVLSFQVVDTGSGISPADQQRIFDPFVQADNKYTRTVGGTGLGLAISSQLVAMMGGQLQVESQLGLGSTFSFTIPVKPSDPDLVTHRRGGSAPIRKLSGRVLLVEDNTVNRTIAAQMLLRAGLEVDTATDGAQAVAYFAGGDRHCDAVLMDIHMPVLDGWEATRQIRNLPGGGQVPIIALTANAMSGDRQACLAAGMNDHLAKPFDPAGLVETVARWLPGPGRKAAGPLLQGATPPAQASPPPLDRLAGLRSVGDDAQLYCELLELFAADAPARLGILRAALAQEDQSQIRATAHFLKGSALALGANSLAAAAALLEKRATAGTADDGSGQAVLMAAESVLRAIPALTAELGEDAANAGTGMALVELRECLQASEWVSPELLERVRGELVGRAVPKDMATALLAAVESYDFDRALVALGSIQDLGALGGERS